MFFFRASSRSILSQLAPTTFLYRRDMYDHLDDYASTIMTRIATPALLITVSISLFFWGGMN